MPYACLQFVIMVFPDHTHLLFFKFTNKQSTIVLHKLRLMQNLSFYLKDHNNIELSFIYSMTSTTPVVNKLALHTIEKRKIVS